jgi:hypothetical protein
LQAALSLIKIGSRYSHRLNECIGDNALIETTKPDTSYFTTIVKGIDELTPVPLTAMVAWYEPAGGNLGPLPPHPLGASKPVTAMNARASIESFRFLARPARDNPNGQSAKANRTDVPP